MSDKAWIVWNADCTEGVVFKDHYDALMVVQGFEYMDDLLDHNMPVPTIGLAFTRHAVEPYTIEEIYTCAAKVG